VLEDEIPADDPGDELAKRRIAVGVSATGDGNHARELGVTEAGEGAGDAGEDHGEDEARSGVVSSDVAGEDEDAGADDGADAEEEEGAGAERAVEVFGLGVGDEASDGFAGGEGHESSVVHTKLHGYLYTTIATKIRRLTPPARPHRLQRRI